mgnify:CR=1 FL=1
MPGTSVKSYSSDSSDEYPNYWTIHVDTMPPLPDEIFYIKNVYGEQTISDFKKLICKIINRKVRVTRFYHEGEILSDENTLTFYNKTAEDVCIQHALTTPTKNTLIRWIDGLIQ